MRPDELRFDPARAALLIVDFQERLADAMPVEQRRASEHGITVLVEMARRMEMPILLSEQYPKGLGRTTLPIAAALEQPGTRVQRLEKMEFACTENEEFRRMAGEVGRSQWVVTGMEAHVCVYQTVRGLRAQGAEVHVPSDATCSRRADNYALGLALSEKAGAIITSVEILMFDGLRRAGTDDFKALTRLIK